MNNTEMLKALQARRKVSDFAKYINLSRQATLALLKDDRPHKSQYYNFIKYLIDRFTA